MDMEIVDSTTEEDTTVAITLATAAMDPREDTVTLGDTIKSIRLCYGKKTEISHRWGSASI